MKKMILAAVAASALLLTGCAADSPESSYDYESDESYDYESDESYDGFEEFTRTLNDGRTVTCLVYDGIAMSCDWQTAFEEEEELF